MASRFDDRDPPQDSAGRVPDYPREESRAQQLDRNWAELVQELRVIGTGVQVLFAFLLSIAFQARFAQTTTLQRDLYLATLLLSALAACLLITPVAMHRMLFRIRVKDELVAITNAVSIAGMTVLSLSMVAALVLVADWVAGGPAAWAVGVTSSVVFAIFWFGAPLVLRIALERRQGHPAGSGALLKEARRDG